MLHVLRHYLPLRKGLLVLSETVLITLVLAIGMSWHLRSPTDAVVEQIAHEGFSVGAARLRCLISAFLLSALAQLAISFNELYDFRISNARYDRSARFVTSAGSALAVSVGALTLARLWHLDQVLDFPGLSYSGLLQTLVFSLVVVFVLLWFWRNLFHLLLQRGNFNDRVLILGAGPAAQDLALQMRTHTDAGYDPIGMLAEPDPIRPDARDPEPSPMWRLEGNRARERAAEAAGASAGAAGETATAVLTADRAPAAQAAHEANGILSSEEPLYDLIQRLRVDLIVVALEDRRMRLPTEELLKCRLNGVAVREREALYERITGKIAVEALRPSYLIFNDGFGSSPWSDLAKRGIDVLLSLTGFALTWPLMLATAFAVRLDSMGPILFRQERIGKNGKPFTLLKFRSMLADAEIKTGPVWARDNDPRITRVGRFIRRTRLDELPQLFNVFFGHMSLVGPRPERGVFVNDLAKRIPYYNQRHIVKPGLTGWAQINYPYGNSVEDAREKLQYDLFYIKNRSLLFDLSILFNTVKTVVLRKGT
jgi:exopolysaccharide biosynthesis polyprenyl glycosylphosphotransferase